MAGGREIKTKIKSVQNTRKVTRALEMVSASKIRKAQDLMKSSRPYARLMRQVIGHLAHATAEYKHPFMIERSTTKRVGYIIVSTDRGLCGGLNSNLFRRVLAEIREWQDKGVEVDLICVGQKATSFFRRLKVNMVGSVTHLGEKPELSRLIGVIKVMLDAYTDGRIDRLSLAYNDFVNTMTQKATIDPLLPLPGSSDMVRAHAWDYLYEPDPETVLDHVLTRYVESLVYQSTLENLASE
ncbi:MAG: ATP synthase F1 subunit gamma, partial [Dokdonella sp.]